MNGAYGLSQSFVSRIKSKYIGHNTYAGRRSNFRSKPKPIDVPLNKSDFKYSYLRSRSNWLPKVFSQDLINCSSLKLSYAYMKIDPVINGFSTNEIEIDLRICDNSIVTLGIRGFCLGFQTLLMLTF